MPKSLLGIVVSLVLAAILLPAPAFAGQAQPQDIIIRGMEACRTQGHEAAVKTWLAGSPLDDRQNNQGMAGFLDMVSRTYGKCVGHELLDVVEISPRSSMVYVEMEYDKGPVFGRFLVFKAAAGWIVTGKFDLHTDPRVVLPPRMLE